MLTLEDIKKWRKSLEITQKELSKAGRNLSINDFKDGKKECKSFL